MRLSTILAGISPSKNSLFFPIFLAESQMKLIQRRAFGFRNFNNYRLRVIAQCG